MHFRRCPSVNRQTLALIHPCRCQRWIFRPGYYVTEKVTVAGFFWRCLISYRKKLLIKIIPYVPLLAVYLKFCLPANRQWVRPVPLIELLHFEVVPLALQKTIKIIWELINRTDFRRCKRTGVEGVGVLNKNNWLPHKITTCQDVTVVWAPGVVSD